MEQIRKPAAGEQYLDAFASLRATKNWAWWLLLVSILLSVAAFAMVRWTGLVQDSPSFQAAKQAAMGLEQAAAPEDAAAADDLPATVPAEPPATAPAPAKPVRQPVPANASRAEDIYQGLDVILPMVKTLALISAILLSVSLFAALMVVCAGRLGGAGQLASALVWSVVLGLVLVPWDAVFGTQFIPGVLVSRQEIVAKSASAVWTAAAWYDVVLYYLRFVGWPVLAVLIWLTVQFKFARAYRQVYLGARTTQE